MITRKAQNSKQKINNQYVVTNQDKLGVGNTQLKPVASIPYTNSTKSKSCNVSDLGVSYFFDWVTLFGENLADMSIRQVEFLVEQFLHGRFWKTPECYHLDLDDLHVQRLDCFSETRPASGKKWNYRYENSVGVKLYVCHKIVNDLIDESRIDSIKLEMSGSVLGALFPRNNQIKLIEMIEIIQSISTKIHCTRIDSTIEFGHNLIKYEDMLTATNLENYSGAKKAKVIYEVEHGKGLQYPTIYFGSDKSDKKTRIYETGKKHGYEGIRIEVQNKGKYARKIISDLIKMYNNDFSTNHRNEKVNCIHALKINHYIRDFNLSKKTFSFVNRSSKKHWMSLRDYQDLPFWKEFKEKLNSQEMNYFFPKKELNIQTSTKWILRQVTGIMRVIQQSMGNEYLTKFIRYAMKINEEKYGGGFSENNAKLVGQIMDLGIKADTEIFDFATRCQLRKVGFYDNPIYAKGINNFNIFDYEYSRVHPRSYQQELQF